MKPSPASHSSGSRSPSPEAHAHASVGGVPVPNVRPELVQVTGFEGPRPASVHSQRLRRTLSREMQNAAWCEPAKFKVTPDNNYLSSLLSSSMLWLVDVDGARGGGR